MHRVAHAKDWFDSGVVALTGWNDGPPVLPPGSAASQARSLTDVLAYATGGLVDVDGAALLAERAAFTGWQRNGTTAVGGRTRMLPALDGWIVLCCARPDDPALMGALIGEEISDCDPWPQVESWVRKNRVAEVDTRIELLGLAGGQVDRRDSVAELVSMTPPQTRSVEGALVVDFSALWAGPLCANLLSLAGARVVKVETPQRPDGARRGNADFYRLLHAGHESVVLDPNIESERAALHRLVGRADIVIEASRPRALRRFGLEAKEFVERGALWVSITAHGRGSDRIGFGDDVAATSGLIARDVDGTPLFVGDAIADPLTGLTAAAAVFSSPREPGRLWDISMSDVVRSTLTPTTAPPRTPDLGIPRARTAYGLAPESGQNTESVLREFAIST